MDKKSFHFISIIVIIFLWQINKVMSQQYITNANNIKADTLSLTGLIQEVILNNPSVKVSEETIKEAGTKIGLARTGYYPNLEFNASYTRLGPMSSISIPHLGSFELYPANNYSTALNFNINILDFGKTSRNIDYENENRIMAEHKLEQVKQTLSLMTINCYFNIFYLQEAIKIKDDQLADLTEHLDFIQKKRETGSAIQYDILTTQVKISGVESQKIDLESSLGVQQSVLNSLLGNPPFSIHYVKADTSGVPIDIQQDSLIPYAVNHRDEMVIAKDKTTSAELHLNVLKATNYPLINIFASGGWKNGYFPDLNTMTANYVAGIGITLPIFDAGRNSKNLLLAKSTIIEDNFETELARRKIENEVVENMENLNAAKKKVDQFNLQLSQAQSAYALAEVNFKEGAITNLDLLDASTNVSEIKLMLLKSKIDYILNLYRLQASIGERLY